VIVLLIVGLTMAYQVIARKWRPQSFQKLIGQDHIARTIKNALKNGRLPHALLFTGPRGTGKTSSARILAKSLRCPHAVDFEPCNQCTDCQDIALGRSVDVVEIDGASNNGVDAIRELRENVAYRPSHGKYKLYIIDEVHMLSTSAFNALLKTLEEPPEHVLFILATTELQKIPVTVLSRCQRFEFRRIPTAVIAEHLKNICQAENIDAEDAALWVVARQGDGSMRDSQSLLDQVISFSDAKITLEQTNAILGLTDRTLIMESLQALLSAQPQGMLEVVLKLSRSGQDPHLFMENLLEFVRHLIFLKLSAQNHSSPSSPSSSSTVSGGDRGLLLELPDSEVRRLSEMVEATSVEDLHLIFDMGLKGSQDMLRAQDAALVLEVVLLRLCTAPRWQDLGRWMAASQSVSPGSASSSAPMSASSFGSSLGSSSAAGPAAVAAPLSAPLSARLSPNEVWFSLVQKAKSRDPLMGAKLESLAFLGVEGKKVQLSAKPQMDFLRTYFATPEAKQVLDKWIREFWSAEHEFEFQKSGDLAKAVTASSMAEAKGQQSFEQEKKRLEQHPRVKLARTKLDLDIKSIEPIR
jgi:DNA polymerase III subunit gamma/tau